MEERQRKKRLNLNEQQWERVRAFVKQFFEEQPEQASKATCQSLFKEIQGQYPCFILSKSAFEKHVGRIEKLKADAGVENFRKYCQRASEKFHEILIGLPSDEFECIQFDGLIQLAHEVYPDLHITDRNKKTLAKHCPIKQLKARAREQRPGDAPAAQTVQTQEPADPAQALGAAAADIDGQRLAEQSLRRALRRQGRSTGWRSDMATGALRRLLRRRRRLWRRHAGWTAATCATAAAQAAVKPARHAPVFPRASAAASRKPPARAAAAAAAAVTGIRRMARQRRCFGRRRKSNVLNPRRPPRARRRHPAPGCAPASVAPVESRRMAPQIVI